MRPCWKSFVADRFYLTDLSSPPSKSRLPLGCRPQCFFWNPRCTFSHLALDAWLTDISRWPDYTLVGAQTPGFDPGGNYKRLVYYVRR
jgi:hypothetical protein